MPLNQLLTENLKYSALYRGGLSNHLSMALIALHRLGASEDRLQEFYARYSKRLEVRTEPLPERSLEQVDGLAAGIGAAAFHGLIRTAYALEAGHAGELHAALDSWAQSDLPLGETRQPVLDLQLPKVQGDSIHERMRQMAANEHFQARLVREGPIASLQDVRQIALRTYMATDGDFTALHLVTAAHAFRVVHSARPLPMEPFLAALSAAWITIGPPTGDGAWDDVAWDGDFAPPEDSWEAIVAQALKSPNEHTPKFVYTCQEEERVTGDVRYRTLAAHRVRLA